MRKKDMRSSRRATVRIPKETASVNMVHAATPAKRCGMSIPGIFLIKTSASKRYAYSAPMLPKKTLKSAHRIPEGPRYRPA